MASLNRAAVSYANSLISSGNVDTSSSWSFDAADGNRLLGDGGDDWTRYGKVHLGVNTAETEKTKAYYGYPFAKFKGDTITLYRSGLTAIRQRAGQQNETDIFDAAGRMIDAIDKKTKGSASMTAPDKLSFTATVGLDLEGRDKPADKPEPMMGPDGEPMMGPDGKPMMKKPRRMPTFSIKAYTGAVMSVGGFYSPVVVDLGGLKAARDKIPVLLGHDDQRIIGQTDGITIDASGVNLTGIITGEDENSQSVITHAKNGFEWQASIGANIVRQEFLKAGEKAVVNGREVGGPLLIAREARLYETSFVPIGADSQATANVAASLSPGTLPKGETTMFEQWLTAKGIDPAALADPVRAFLQARYDEEAKASSAVERLTGTLDDIVAKHEQEIERVNRIKAFTDKSIAIRPELMHQYKHLAEVAIEKKLEFKDLELAFMRLERERGHSARTVRHIEQPASNAKTIEATVARSCGLRNLEKSYDQQTLNASDDAFPHGIGLRDLFVLAARENGHVLHSTSDVRSLLQAAFAGQGQQTIRAEGVSTLSLPGIMSNIANKFLLQGFKAVEASWQEVAAIGNARDFKSFYSYNFLMDSVFSKVGPGGELEHATASEIEYTNRVETYGKMFAVTRQDIINDDLGALSQIPMRLGRGAAIGLNMTFWTEFLANLGTFYTSGHGNVSTGAGSALAPDGLKAAQLKFDKQTDPNGDPLAVDARILLVPPELEIVANELMTSLIVNTGGSSTKDQVPNRNVWANKYRTVMSRYLSNTNITGSSTTAWWLIADPADLPVIQVAFLNGRQEPVVESADADFNVLGIQFRGFFDFGTKKQEFRAAVRSAGT